MAGVNHGVTGIMPMPVPMPVPMPMSVPMPMAVPMPMSVCDCA